VGILLRLALVVAIMSPYLVAIDPACSAPSKSFEESAAANNRGVDLFNAGRYKQAIKYFDKAVELNSRNVEAYSNRGAAYDSLKEHQKAIDDYSRAIRYNPGLTAAYGNRAAAYHDLGQFDKAIKDYDRILRSSPRSAHTYTRRADAYQKLGQLETALKDYEKALSISRRERDAEKGRQFILKVLHRSPGALPEVADVTKDDKDKLAQKAKADKLAAEKLAAEKVATEKAAAEKVAAEKAAAEKATTEKVAAEKVAAEKAAAEKAATEKVAADKLAAEKAAADEKGSKEGEAQQTPSGQDQDGLPVANAEERLSKQLASRLPKTASVKPITQGESDTIQPSAAGSVDPFGMVSNVVHHMLGNICFMFGQQELAAANFTQAAKANPLDPFAFYRRGNAYAASGQYVNALHDYDAALSLKPGFKQAQLKHVLITQHLQQPGTQPPQLGASKTVVPSKSPPRKPKPEELKFPE
jgi:tetratricopeptide (TPR) repeat protein